MIINDLYNNKNSKGVEEGYVPINIYKGPTSPAPEPKRVEPKHKYVDNQADHEQYRQAREKYLYNVVGKLDREVLNPEPLKGLTAAEEFMKQKGLGRGNADLVQVSTLRFHATGIDASGKRVVSEPLIGMKNVRDFYKQHGINPVASTTDLTTTDDGDVTEDNSGPVMHRIGLTVTDPNHPMVSKRGETIQKTVRVKGDDREKAINSAIAHLRRKGYKVHDHHYIGTVDQGVAEGFLNEASSDEAWELVGQPVPEIQQFVKQMGYGNDEQSVAKITPIIDKATATQIPAASIPKLKNLANKGNDAQTLKAIQQISGRPDAAQQYTKIMQARDAGEGRQRDVSGYLQYVKSGNYDPPVLLKLPTGLYVVGGRTRLYAALALGVPANVKIISANNFKQGVAEVSLGDYRKKAMMSKAMAQTDRFFDRNDPAAVAAADQTIAKRERGLASADARSKPYTPPVHDAEKQQRDLTARYPNIDELVADAEQRRDQHYDRAEGDAYYRGRDAEQNYQKLKQIQRVIQGLNESLNRSHLP